MTLLSDASLPVDAVLQYIAPRKLTFPPALNRPIPLPFQVATSVPSIVMIMPCPSPYSIPGDIPSLQYVPIYETVIPTFRVPVAEKEVSTLGGLTSRTLCPVAFPLCS